jgi:hypothetical protein
VGDVQLVGAFPHDGGDSNLVIRVKVNGQETRDKSEPNK